MDINLRSNNYKHLYDDLYFQDRNFVDKKRLKSFCQEKGFIHKYVKGGLICDVGCGTGEFLSYIERPLHKSTQIIPIITPIQ